MTTLRIIEVYSYTEWLNATYRANNGDIFNILFSNNFNSKKTGEHRTLISAEHCTVSLSTSDPLWAEIETAIQQHNLDRLHHAA